MGLDDDVCAGGGEHDFQVASAEYRIGLDGQGSDAFTEYRCRRCDAVSWMGPEDPTD